jgi:uncharacterized membrane protein YbaN (DUF454 family)
LKKKIILLCGYLFLILGFIGIAVPLMPTTPFLLLAAYCFLKSSNKLYLWLINHRVFGKQLQMYMEYKAISIKTKILSIVFLWISITVSLLFFMKWWLIRLIVILIASSVSFYLITRKTLTKEMVDSLNKQQ